jgi:molybdate transport system permease protein
MDWYPFWLSVRVSLLATAIGGTAGLGFAYLLAKGRFRGRSLLEAVLMVPIVLPPTVLGYYLLVVLGVNGVIGRAWESITGSPLVFTPAAAVVAASIAALPFVVRTGRAAIEDVDPRLEAAARVAGHPEWKVALLVTLPMARRGIIAGLALGFARALGEFGMTVMVAGNIPGRTQTLPIKVYDAVQASDFDTARTGSLLLVAAAVVVLVTVARFGTRRT